MTGSVSFLLVSGRQFPIYYNIMHTSAYFQLFRQNGSCEIRTREPHRVYSTFHLQRVFTKRAVWKWASYRLWNSC